MKVYQVGKILDISVAQQLAYELMKEHGLNAKGWIFEFDTRSIKRQGVCLYGPQLIKVSLNTTVQCDEEYFRQIMLHEIAHALLPVRTPDGKKIGHNKEWVRKSREIGYRYGRTIHPYNQKPLLSSYTVGDEIVPGWIVSKNKKAIAGEYVYSHTLGVSLVNKVNRTRYSIYSPSNDGDFLTYFTQSIKVEPLFESLKFFAPPTQIPNFAVGDKVKVETDSRKWSGFEGYITKINPKTVQICNYDTFIALVVDKRSLILL